MIDLIYLYLLSVVDVSGMSAIVLGNGVLCVSGRHRHNRLDIIPNAPIINIDRPVTCLS